MGRLGNSWNVFKQSLTVVKQDKELLLLPVIAGLASFLIFLSFVFPAYTVGLLERAASGTDQNAEYTVYGLMLVMYLILSFITIYFQAALMFGADERLGGGNPTLGTALRGANKRLGKIFVWSLFAATVSLLIQALEAALRRFGNQLAASIIGSILGTAWTLMTFFVIPAVVFENKGPFDALKRSGSLFKQRWGESLVGHYGIGAIMGLFTFLSILGIGFVAFLVGSINPTIMIAVLVIGILWLVFLAVLGAALSGVYKVALYRFATKGQVAPQFTPESIQNAYTPTHVSASRL
jgi:hypothetical protein